MFNNVFTLMKFDESISNDVYGLKNQIQNRFVSLSNESNDFIEWNSVSEYSYSLVVN